MSYASHLKTGIKIHQSILINQSFHFRFSQSVSLREFRPEFVTAEINTVGRSGSSFEISSFNSSSNRSDLLMARILFLSKIETVISYNF